MQRKYLLHDEIAEILRISPIDSDIRIGETVFRFVHRVSFDDGILSDIYYYEEKDKPNPLRKNRRNLIDSIYDAIESGQTVTINGKNIFEI